jgi:hypothetical protein
MVVTVWRTDPWSYHKRHIPAKMSITLHVRALSSQWDASMPRCISRDPIKDGLGTYELQEDDGHGQCDGQHVAIL